jgi:hypothetical protein
VPDVHIVGPTAVCERVPTSFVATSDFWGSGVFLHDWDFGDGVVLLGVDRDLPVWHEYLDAGSYEMTFHSVREDDPSCFAVASHAVEVGATPRADAGPDVQAPAVIGTAGLPGFVYSWTPTAGLDDPSTPQPTADPAQTMEYCVSVSPVTGGCEMVDCALVEVDSGCGIDPTAVAGFWMAKWNGSDLRYGWQVDPLAGGGYSVRSLEDRSRLPTVAAANTTAVEVASTPDAFTVATVESGGMSREPSMRYYAVVSRCP